MKDVVVISEDQRVYRMFSSALAHLPVHFTWLGNIDEAAGVLRTERPDFVFFAVRNIVLMNNWLGRYKGFKLKIPFICFTSYQSWERRELLWMAGAAEVVELPRLKKEFLIIIENIFSRRSGPTDKKEMTGSLSVFNVIDLIQTFEDSHKNGIIHLRSCGNEAEMLFNKGRLVNVHFGSRDPLDAVRVMSVWQEGDFTIKMDKVRHAEMIKLENQQVILECQNYLMKREKIIHSLREKDLVYYAAPMLDFEQIGPMARKYILFFKDGKTITDFIEYSIDAPLRILSDIERWLKKNWLLKKTQYKEQLYLLKKNENRSAVSKLLQRVFSKENDKVNISYSTDIPEETARDDEGFILKKEQKDYYFSNTELLDTFIEQLEKSR